MQTVSSIRPAKQWKGQDMAAIRFSRMRGLGRVQWIAAAAALSAVAIYLLVLRQLDHRAAAYLEGLRETDPTTYLTDLREVRGYDAFLTEYARLEGFDEFRPQPPGFLIGRWTMRDDMLRLTRGQAPKSCTDPATFEYGLFISARAEIVSLPVAYRLSGSTVEMRMAGDRTLPIRLIAYGARLDHLEFTPPGETRPVHAYLCGR
tara:strand:+ start:3926 stop:4537 length:612 start_codon:yes stop_codon:yes gene_type:complete